MTNTTIGILAHVDAGKTTLSESILYLTGAIRTRGRVDHGDAFLDTDALEKKRGITIYSKLARFELNADVPAAGCVSGAGFKEPRPGKRDGAIQSAQRAGGTSAQGRSFTLLDTPGHADFSPEMERTLRVLDAAVLVVSAADLAGQRGADPQVLTLWRLLAHYEVPTILFVNKMDQQRTGAEPEQALRARLFALLRASLGAGLVPFDERQLCKDNEEAAAVCDDALLERVLEGDPVSEEDAAELIARRKLFPVYFGSALRDEGTAALLEGLRRYTRPVPASAKEKPFGAVVYKITRESGTRLTWMKITSGTLSVRDSVRQEAAAPSPPVRDAAARTGPAGNHPMTESAAGLSGIGSAGRSFADPAGEGNDADGGAQEAGPAQVEEKISELRLYSGSRYAAVPSAGPGEIVAAAGLSHTRAGDGLGREETNREELLTPIMTSTVTAQDLYGRQVDVFTLMKALRGLEEQEPMLQPSQDEETGDLCVRIMGQVQTEILREQLRERYGLRARFGPGTIVYRETIRRPVEGVGHFEPLRHYAEVHLVLEPGEPGSGLVFADDCPPDTLERNWRNLILTHLGEKVHRGVLTGSAITDMKISLIGARASRKHTSGGDFRKATYAAVRQGLMMAENVLLEPVLAFRLEVPAEQIGRAMTDIGRMYGHAGPVQIGAAAGEGGPGGGLGGPAAAGRGSGFGGGTFDAAAGTGEYAAADPQGGMAVLEGTVPAAELGDYAQTVSGYTGGRGHLSVSLAGYEPCHNAREVIDRIGYDPDADRRNPTWSVFCSHGAGTVVPWDRVREYMQVDTGWQAPASDGPFLTDDYYTFTGESTELFEIDRGGDEDSGSASPGPAAPAGAPGQGSGAESGGPCPRQNAGRGDPGGGDHRVRRDRRDFRERQRDYYAGEEELRRIFERTYGPVKRNLRHPENERYYGEDAQTESGGNGAGTAEPDGGAGEKRAAAGTGSGGSASAGTASGAPGGAGKGVRRGKKSRQERPDEYLLVDGYNIIFAWADLKELAAADIGAARESLLDILSDYAGYTGLVVIAVFDAYKVAGGKGQVLRRGNIDVVYTKEAETADLYIEKTAHRLTKNHRVTVATGDFVEQVIIFGAGALRMSPRGLLEAILAAKQEQREQYLS